jgi:hypothetical protein
MELTLSSYLTKRIKLYSLGKWVDTAPLVLENNQIVPGNLIIKNKH